MQCNSQHTIFINFRSLNRKWNQFEADVYILIIPFLADVIYLKSKSTFGNVKYIPMTKRPLHLLFSLLSIIVMMISFFTGHFISQTSYHPISLISYINCSINFLPHFLYSLCNGSGENPGGIKSALAMQARPTITISHMVFFLLLFFVLFGKRRHSTETSGREKSPVSMDEYKNASFHP